jgi:hypothetical protein
MPFGQGRLPSGMRHPSVDSAAIPVNHMDQSLSVPELVPVDIDACHKVKEAHAAQYAGKRAFFFAYSPNDCPSTDLVLIHRRCLRGSGHHTHIDAVVLNHVKANTACAWCT